MSWASELGSYDSGLDILGARATRTVMGGGGVQSWDNHNTYAKDDTVYYNGKYYRAIRQVDPPFLPVFMSGEVPGESDSWRDTAQPSADLLGMVDMHFVQANLNALTPVTYEIARILVKSGQDVIAQAIAGAKQPWYKSDLPGETERKNVQAHLQWHADTLARFTGDKYAVYPPLADLKKYVVMAYVDGNAVETGAAYLDSAWNAMWDEIQTKLAAMPRAVLAAAGAAMSKIVEGATGIPMWAWAVGGTMVAGLLGFIAWKVINAPVGQMAVRRYLP